MACTLSTRMGALSFAASVGCTDGLRVRTRTLCALLALLSDAACLARQAQAACSSPAAATTTTCEVRVRV